MSADDLVTSHYLNKLCPTSLMWYGVTRPQWVNITHDTIWLLKWFPSSNSCFISVIDDISMTVCIMAWDWLITMPLSKSKMLQFTDTVYPKKYAHGFVVLCFVVVMQSFIMNSHEVFIHIHQGCFAGTGAIVRFPQCQWSKPDGYGKISQCITTTKHSKAKTVCIFLGIYCTYKKSPGYCQLTHGAEILFLKGVLFWFIFHWCELFLHHLDITKSQWVNKTMNKNHYINCPYQISHKKRLSQKSN